ncbi:N-acetyl sugar amidotransferase [Thermodesulfobacteriota bacterium]
MEYCARCVYPENAKPTIIFDDEGVCSGCRYHESREKIDWGEREKMLRVILEEYKAKAREAGNSYDCIIPVSGGKDSHFQTHLLKNVYGMNPLLVTYNHSYNSRLGVRNLNNIVEKFGVDLIRFTTNPKTARTISRYMLKKVGDLTWHYHAGIRTLPFQIAVKYKIPLIVWGEHGFAELTGLVTLEDLVEFTKWTRQEHDMRGYEPHELINEESGITSHDIAPFIYPADEEIEELGVRGIYLSNFIYWDALEHAKIMHNDYDFGIHPGPREKTFILHGKTDDHANDVHDYLKYLKFGYGRATDDVSMEIRHGRMKREEGIELVRKYDHIRPSTLDFYLEFLGVSEKKLIEWIEPMRDPDIWKKEPNGEWIYTDSVVNHMNDTRADKVRPKLVPVEERTFGKNNIGFYWKDSYETKKCMRDIRGFHKDDNMFIVL